MYVLNHHPIYVYYVLEFSPDDAKRSQSTELVVKSSLLITLVKVRNIFLFKQLLRINILNLSRIKVIVCKHFYFFKPIRDNLHRQRRIQRMLSISRPTLMLKQAHAVECWTSDVCKITGHHYTTHHVSLHCLL